MLTRAYLLALPWINGALRPLGLMMFGRFRCHGEVPSAADPLVVVGIVIRRAP